MKNIGGIKRIILGITGMAVLVSLCGCTALLAGAGTIGIGMDTLRLERYVDYDHAWAASLDALQDMEAVITSGNRDQGIIHASVDKSKIKIQVYQAGDEPAAINISVRRKGLPDLKLADEIVEAINAKFSEKRKSEQDA